MWSPEEALQKFYDQRHLELAEEIAQLVAQNEAMRAALAVPIVPLIPGRRKRV